MVGGKLGQSQNVTIWAEMGGPKILLSDRLFLSAAMSTPDEKYEIITRRLQEVLGGDSIKAILAEGRQPKCYWGTYQ